MFIASNIVRGLQRGMNMKWTKTVCSYCLIEGKYDILLIEYRIQIEEILNWRNHQIICNTFSNYSTERGIPSPILCMWAKLLFKMKSSMQRCCVLPPHSGHTWPQKLLMKSMPKNTRTTCAKTSHTHTSLSRGSVA